MEIPNEYHDYVRALESFIKVLTLADGSRMTLSQFSQPALSANAPAIDYRLSKAGSSPEQVMCLRVNFTSYQVVGGRHELTRPAKTSLRQACEAFCRGEGLSFSV